MLQNCHNTFNIVHSIIRYMSENLDHPERQQPHAYDVWQSIRKQLGPGEKIVVLTSGPLTNLANISLSDIDASSVIEVCSFCTPAPSSK